MALGVANPASGIAPHLRRPGCLDMASLDADLQLVIDAWNWLPKDWSKVVMGFEPTGSRTVSATDCCQTTILVDAQSQVARRQARTMFFEYFFINSMR